MKIFVSLLSSLLIFNAFAAGLVAWAPRIAEAISRYVAGWWSPLIIAVLFLAVIPRLPAALQQSAKGITLAAMLITIPIAFGLVWFPTETRNSVDVPPDQAPRAPTTLMSRLREPWDSAAAERPPAVIDLVHCAAAIYQPPGQLKDTVAKLGFANHVLAVNGPSKGIVMINGPEAVIAFEGTNGVDDVGDWFANLDTARAQIKEGTVHRGFLNHYQLVDDQVLDALASNKVSHVWLTGHSLGGAMAVHCALDLERRGELVVRGVMTFGQPLLMVPGCSRIVNEKLAGRFLRFINEADVVPCVAPGFRGGGSLVWFKDGKLKYCRPTMRALVADDGSVTQDDDEAEGPPPLTESEFAAEKRSVRKQFTSPPPGEPVNAQAMPSVTDHNMERYVDAVQTHYGVR